MLEPLKILLVDDSPGDVALVEEAFREWRIANHLKIAEDGEEALQFLRQEGRFRDEPRPDLVLLDLNLPKKTGREVLAAVKADECLRSIPIIILTTSNAEQDVLRAYDLHANCYLTKPIDMDDFVVKIRAIEDFWLMLVRLPNRS